MPTNLALISELESVDLELERLQVEFQRLQKIIFQDRLQLSHNNFKIEEKVVEYDSLVEKYKTLLSQHSKCSPV